MFSFPCGKDRAKGEYFIILLPGRGKCNPQNEEAQNPLSAGQLAPRGIFRSGPPAVICRHYPEFPYKNMVARRKNKVYNFHEKPNTE